jgi:hypothetical protein
MPVEIVRQIANRIWWKQAFNRMVVYLSDKTRSHVKAFDLKYLFHWFICWSHSALRLEWNFNVQGWPTTKKGSMTKFIAIIHGTSGEHRWGIMVDFQITLNILFKPMTTRVWWPQSRAHADLITKKSTDDRNPDRNSFQNVEVPHPAQITKCGGQDYRALAESILTSTFMVPDQSCYENTRN